MESFKEKEKRKLKNGYLIILCGLILLLCLIGCYPKRTTSQIESRKYQSHKKFEDTSFVYELPFKVNTRHRIIQGYFSRYTHKYKAAVDFKMKNGTPVLAVRDGKVLRIKEDSDIGGWKKKYRGDANYIIIEHTDSTRSSYRHLLFNGVLVTSGERVLKGQIIGYSGNTGYTFSPHLHFMITKYENGQWVSIPCRFKSKDQIGYLKPLRQYTSVNVPIEEQSSTKSDQILAN